MISLNLNLELLHLIRVADFLGYTDMVTELCKARSFQIFNKIKNVWENVTDINCHRKESHFTSCKDSRSMSVDSR